MMRSVLAVVAGIVVMMVGVMAYQGLFLMLPMYLRDPETFRRLMELSRSPDALRQAQKAGEVQLPGQAILAGTVLLDAVCAALGGYVTARIAKSHAMMHVMVLATLMTLWSIVHAATNDLESILPVWVPWSRALLSVPIGVVAGGWFEQRKRTGAAPAESG